MDELVNGQLVGSRLNNNKNTSTSPLHQVIMFCARVWGNSNTEFIKFQWVSVSHTFCRNRSYIKMLKLVLYSVHNAIKALHIVQCTNHSPFAHIETSPGRGFNVGDTWGTQSSTDSWDTCDNWSGWNRRPSHKVWGGPLARGGQYFPLKRLILQRALDIKSLIEILRSWYRPPWSPQTTSSQSSLSLDLTRF